MGVEWRWALRVVRKDGGTSTYPCHSLTLVLREILKCERLNPNRVSRAVTRLEPTLQDMNDTRDKPFILGRRSW